MARNARMTGSSALSAHRAFVLRDARVTPRRVALLGFANG
jgi:hypothetical protein